jgi:hypothetical protein
MLWSQFFAIFSTKFRRKKLAFFVKKQCNINYFHKLAVFWVKRHYLPIFRRKYFQNYNIGPGCQRCQMGFGTRSYQSHFLSYLYNNSRLRNRIFRFDSSFVVTNC